MNDFEDKLRALRFRAVPSDLRRSVLAAAETPNGSSRAWTWRDWLWPSPLAWAALALLWTGTFTVDALMGKAPEPTAVSKSAEAPNPGLPAFQPRGREMAFLDILH